MISVQFSIYRVLSELVPFLESDIPPWVFFTVLKFSKWYQIAQSVSYKTDICNVLFTYSTKTVVRFLFLNTFIKFLQTVYVCKCLGVYPKLLALNRKDFQFRDILVLVKVGKTGSFILDYYGFLFILKMYIETIKKSKHQ